MIWRYFQNEKEVEIRLKEEMSPFFLAVAELAENRGFEVDGVKGGALHLNLNGEFAAAVDETGAMSYHPYKEVFDMMDEVAKLREEIPGEVSYNKCMGPMKNTNAGIIFIACEEGITDKIKNGCRFVQV